MRLDILDIIRPSPGFTWFDDGTEDRWPGGSGGRSLDLFLRRHDEAQLAAARSSGLAVRAGGRFEQVATEMTWHSGLGRMVMVKDEGLNLPSAYLVSYLMLFHHLQWTLGPFIDELF